MKKIGILEFINVAFITISPKKSKIRNIACKSQTVHSRVKHKSKNRKFHVNAIEKHLKSEMNKLNYFKMR